MTAALPNRERQILNKISPSISTVAFILVLQTLRFWQSVLPASHRPDEYVRLSGRRGSPQKEAEPPRLMIHEVTGQFRGCMKLNERQHNRDACDDRLSTSNENVRRKKKNPSAEAAQVCMCTSASLNRPWLTADLINRKYSLICVIISLGKTRRRTNWPSIPLLPISPLHPFSSSWWNSANHLTWGQCHHQRAPHVPRAREEKPVCPSEPSDNPCLCLCRSGWMHVENLSLHLKKQ